MSQKPKLRKPDVDLAQLDKFAGGVELEPTEEKPKIIKPWEAPKVRADVIKGMGVPISEPHLLKLQFIAKHTKWSQRKFCQNKLEKAIDKEVKTILKALEAGQPYWSEPE